jgi:hypothetical protein
MQHTFLGSCQHFGGIYCLYLEEGGEIFFQNVVNHLQDYMKSQYWRPQSTGNFLTSQITVAVPWSQYQTDTPTWNCITKWVQFADIQNNYRHIPCYQ